MRGKVGDRPQIVFYSSRVTIVLFVMRFFMIFSSLLKSYYHSK